MSSEFFSVGVVAPLLLWGIWIIAEESIFDRDFLIRKKQRNSQNQVVLIQVLIVCAILGTLVALLNGVISIRFIVLGGIVSALARWYLQTREREILNRLNAELDAQLPPAIQIIAILIAAGVSPIRSLSIVASNSQSKVAQEFSKVVRDVTAGVSMISAIDNFAQRSKTRLAQRFASSIVMALERGSPLTQVLIDYVRDSRHEAKNQIQRRAGRAEIALMIPVVFLILPISVLFALWPSLNRLAAMM